MIDLPLLITSSFAMLSLLSCFNLHAYLDISIFTLDSKGPNWFTYPVKPYQRGNEGDINVLQCANKSPSADQGFTELRVCFTAWSSFSLAQVMVYLIVFKSANTYPDNTSGLEHHPGSLHA